MYFDLKIGFMGGIVSLLCSLIVVISIKTIPVNSFRKPSKYDFLDQ